MSDKIGPLNFDFLLNFRIFEDHNNNKRYYSNNLNNMRLLNSIRGNGKDRVIFTESKSNFFVERTGIESIRQSRVDLIRSANHQYHRDRRWRHWAIFGGKNRDNFLSIRKTSEINLLGQFFSRISNLVVFFSLENSKTHKKWIFLL